MTPTTDSLINDANSLAKLAASAELDPAVKADLQAQFDSYSHSPIVMGLVTIAGSYLTQQHITVDNTLLTVAIGAIVTGIGYGYQWVSMKMRKPVPKILAS